MRIALEPFFCTLIICKFYAGTNTTQRRRIMTHNLQNTASIYTPHEIYDTVYL